MDGRETATSRDGGTVLDHAEEAEPRSDRASVGRASAPTVSAPGAVPDEMRPAPTVYRTGQGPVPTSGLDPDRPDAELPARIPGQTRAEADSSWKAFDPPRQRPATEEPTTPDEGSSVARASASVPGAAPVTPADVFDAVKHSAGEPRTYRAGEPRTYRVGATGTADSGQGHAPTEPPEPAEPPEPVSPPQPVEPPEPVSPPEPAEPPPGPSPFPSPTPVPTPPRPVPPEPPTPQPEPGPPYPPQPPVPPSPVPPGPAPVPPFPPPPPAIADAAPATRAMPAITEAVPAPSLPTWPPSLLGAAPTGKNPPGTVYSGSPVTSQPIPLEYSGSLTGHILSQGTETPSPESRTTRVVVIMTVVMTALVVAGIVVAVFTRNALIRLLTGA